MPKTSSSYGGFSGYNPGNLGGDLREQNNNIRKEKTPEGIEKHQKIKIMRAITTELKVLVYSLVVIFFCFNCSKEKQQYSNPVFATFFNELSNLSTEQFYNSYYKDKPIEYKEGYIQVLKEFKKYNCEFTVTDYNSYKGEKPDLDGMTEGVYILENKNLKDPFFVKIEKSKVKYLLSIGKGKEDIIGWL